MRVYTHTLAYSNAIRCSVTALLDSMKRIRIKSAFCSNKMFVVVLFAILTTKLCFPLCYVYKLYNCLMVMKLGAFFIQEKHRHVNYTCIIGNTFRANKLNRLFILTTHTYKRQVQRESL